MKTKNVRVKGDQEWKKSGGDGWVIGGRRKSEKGLRATNGLNGNAIPFIGFTWNLVFAVGIKGEKIATDLQFHYCTYNNEIVCPLCCV